MRINGRKIKNIISDFDGTIIRQGMTAPEERFYELMNQCLAEGIFFVAASGRQYPNLHRLLQRLDQEIAYIAENGSLVMYRGEVIHKSIIDQALAEELLEDMLQENAYIMVSGQGTSYLLERDPEFIHHVKEVMGNDTAVVADFAEVAEPMIKISMYLPAGIPQELADRYHEKYDACFQVVDAGNDWFDFTPKGSSKGAALQVLAEKLQLELEHSAAFGDGENDIAMLKEAGLKFAMDTANPKVQASADLICSNVEDVLQYGLDLERELGQYALDLAVAAGKTGEEAECFWEALSADPEILEEFEYFYTNRDFLCRHKVAGYSIVDILVWQVDHFKAYLDRHFDVNRYDRDRLVCLSFEVLLNMRRNPKFYTDKLEGETGTDFEVKRS